MMRTLPILILATLAIAMGCTAGSPRPAAHSATTQPIARDSSHDSAAQSLRLRGNLDLENGASIRWRRPDGSGYVNILTLDKSGTLQLCHDPYYFEQPHIDDDQGKPAKRANELDHTMMKVIEVRNPNSAYPDLRLPIT